MKPMFPIDEQDRQHYLRWARSERRDTFETLVLEWLLVTLVGASVVYAVVYAVASFVMR